MPGSRTGIRRWGRSTANIAAIVIQGNCHIVPNHARIILALLYGDDDFQNP